MAIQFSKHGANLILAARNRENLIKVAEFCQTKGGKALAVQTDITDKIQCKQLIERAIQEFGRIDTLINNAGISMLANFDEIEDITLLEKIMKVNYFGSMYCTHFALPYLKKTKGRIVAVSSLTGKTGVPTRSGYSASKHAMAGFFDSIRIELAGSGVSVTTLYPGFIATEMRENALNKDGVCLGISPMNESNMMSVSKGAGIIINAIAKRKREVVMTFKAKFGLWVKLIFPGLVDYIAKKAVEK